MKGIIVAITVLSLCVALLAQDPKTPEAKRPPMLKVVGNKIVTVDGGTEVWLQGVNIPSLEWGPDGDDLIKSAEVAIADWHANVIRLPLSQDRWFGKGERQTDEGEAYRQRVDEMVAYCASKGAYVIIDLHWSDAGHWGKYMQQKNMPDPNSVTFWKDAAKRYANHPAVLFDLYNEPRNITWDVWRNGGEMREVADNKDPLVYQTVGMQGILDAVRSTGAKNIVLAGGIDWAYDLSGILKGFALLDTDGNGVVYSTHIYPWKGDWENKVGAIAKYHPVLVGEVGCEIDAKQESPYTWGPDMLGYIQQKKLHWTGWCFHPSASPRMLQDFDKFTPTPYWGAFAKAALLGAKFTPSRLR